ncbi:MAG TPA: uracil-DNA glycosylase [Candidatus Fimadaptatus faecigallinarum]|uniref:Type-4 uracil-DNA glycosylase n=1 Tax=Candidatus Fimadaptatus faecigallinarum TaxID=2840814 RepID=A0A9D1S494_9FIRM|nr:uracil-DNA glycosylase [Candidatus Fimadaptatus faecigallinarum]
MLEWDEIERAVNGCEACRLCKGRHNAVPGEGRRDADIMLIGEGPGEQEDLSGRPFVGPAGQLLDRMLAAVGLERGEVYIANVVKCRPPRNRQPERDEAEACLPYLRAQVALVRPRIIVLLGATAARNAIGPDIRITRDRGRWYEKDGVELLVTYHPSALLRDASLKRAAWEDFKGLRARALELGIELGEAQDV